MLIITFPPWPQAGHTWGMAEVSQGEAGGLQGLPQNPSLTTLLGLDLAEVGGTPAQLPGESLHPWFPPVEKSHSPLPRIVSA